MLRLIASEPFTMRGSVAPIIVVGMRSTSAASANRRATMLSTASEASRGYSAT